MDYEVCRILTRISYQYDEPPPPGEKCGLDQFKNLVKSRPDGGQAGQVIYFSIVMQVNFSPGELS